MISSVQELEKLLDSDQYILKFLYVSPSSEKPERHWWCPPRYEPYQDVIAEQDPFPNQAVIFWQLCDSLGRPPTQDELGKLFFKTYKPLPTWAHLFGDEWSKWGAEARVRRTYPSLIREYHLEFLLRHVFGDADVRRSRKLDNMGVDFQVCIQGEWQSIRTYVDTQRSKQFAKEKSEKRHKGLEATDLLLTLSQGVECGMYKLYSKLQVEQIKRTLNDRVSEVHTESDGL